MRIKLLVRHLVSSAALICLSTLLSCSAGARHSGLDVDPADSSGATRSAPRLQPQALPGTGTLGLPRPSELPRNSSKLPFDVSRVCDSAQFQQSPLQKVALSPDPRPQFNWRTTPGARFSPTSPPGAQPQLGDSAYALYEFGAFVDVSGPLELTCNWVAPKPSGLSYVGLADYSLNRWDWFKLPASEHFMVQDIAKYIKDPLNTGTLMVAVVLLGTEAHDLDCVVLGPPFIQASLYADLDVNPAQNLAPRDVNFWWGGSMAGADLVSFDLDVDGQPGYEITGDTTGVAMHHFDIPGQYTAHARVHDSQGGVTVFTKDFTIVNPANQAPLASFVPSVTSGTAPLEVTLDASGSSDPDGQIVDYQWDVEADGKIDFDTGTNPVLHYTFGGAGQTFIVLKVKDNDFATDGDVQFVDVTKGWKINVVQDNVTYPKYSVAVTGSGQDARACVAFERYNGQPDSDSLTFVRALSADGSSWGTPQILESGKHIGGDHPSICVLPSDTPMIAYGYAAADIDPETLRVIRATDYTGQAWYAAQTIGFGGVGTDNAAALIGGQPAVVSIKRDGAQSEVDYFRANDAEGLSWGTSVVAVPEVPNQISSPALTDSPGHPLLEYEEHGNAVQAVELMQANDAFGGAWHGVATFTGLDSGHGNFLPLSNGDILTAFGYSGQGRHTWVSRSTTLGASWLLPQDMSPGPERLGGFTSMALLGTTPALCWNAWNCGDLMYSTADDSGQTWSEPYAIWSIGSTGDSPMMVSVNGKPLIVFYDSTAKTIYAAWLDE